MATLSLCLIVKNEERWLPALLSSAKPFVDELIVADTGSVDRTVEFAQNAGATVLHVPWEHDFAQAKNAAIAKATKDWILVLDADERITEDDFKRLRTLIESTSADAFKLELRNYVPRLDLGCVACPPSEASMQATAYRPIKLVRLFRNKRGFHFENRVHELVEHTVEAAGGRIAEAGIPVHHYGILFPTNLRHKMRYYAWLIFKQLQDEPNNVRVLYLAGQFEHERGNSTKALEYYGRVAKLDPAYRNVWFVIANIQLEQKQFDKAMQAYEQSLMNNPDSPNTPQAINNLSVLYANAGRKQDAAELLQVALKKYPTNAAVKKNAEQFGLLKA
jgi:glycosyltransferase involved in cell wall biosynthesis